MNYSNLFQIYNNINSFDIAFHIETCYKKLTGVFKIFNILKKKILNIKGYISNISNFKLKNKIFPYYILADNKYQDIRNLYSFKRGYKFNFLLSPSQPPVLFEFIKIFRTQKTFIPQQIKGREGYNLICYWKGNVNESWSFLQTYLGILYLLHYLDNLLSSIFIYYQDKFKILTQSINELIKNLDNYKLHKLFLNKNKPIVLSEQEQMILRLYAKLITNQ